MKDFDIPAHIQIAEFDAAVQAQSLAEIKNAMKRHLARMAEFTEWVRAENIRARFDRHEKDAATALAAAGPIRASMAVPCPLPACMVGQSDSTIQAMLRNGWRPE